MATHPVFSVMMPHLFEDSPEDLELTAEAEANVEAVMEEMQADSASTIETTKAEDSQEKKAKAKQESKEIKTQA